MTTATATHAPSRGCYQAGCRTEACAQAAYRYEKQLSVEHARGQRRLIDATQTRTHIERLVANGWSHRHIARAAGSARSVITAIVNDQQEIRTSTARAVLAIHIGPPPGIPSTVNSVGSMRRIRALMTIGHACPAIGACAGMSPDKIERIAAGLYPAVTRETADVITRVYRQLLTTPGPSWRAQRHARKHGWHGPLAWDNIDDPNCRPETEHRASRARASTRPKVYADATRVAELTAAGKSAAEIALELGCHQRTVVRARGRVVAGAVAA